MNFVPSMNTPFMTAIFYWNSFMKLNTITSFELLINLKTFHGKSRKIGIIATQRIDSNFNQNGDISGNGFIEVGIQLK